MQMYEPTPREQVERLLEETKTTSKRGKVKKKRSAWHIFTSIISTLLILVLVFTLGSLIKTRMEGGYAELFGYRIFQVETGSMIPTLPVGSFIVAHTPQDAADLPVGTVITYKHESAVVTHRIIELKTETDEETGETRRVYGTKGDNPDNSVDPWTVSPDDILGEMVWHFSFSLGSTKTATEGT